MSVLKFIHKLKELFGITPNSNDIHKKKTIKELIKKLKLRRIALREELKKECDTIKRESLKDNIQIIKKQIKKGEELLDD